MPSAKQHSRPPFASSRWYRTPSTERDDRMEMKSDRTIRSTSLQRPSTYLPAFDHIWFVFFFSCFLVINSDVWFDWLIVWFLENYVWSNLVFSILILVILLISELYIFNFSFVKVYVLFFLGFQSAYAQEIHTADKIE